MDSSLSLESPPKLASILAGGPISLFLDFDGTLVELAPGPDAIRPRNDLVDRLDALSTRIGGRCAIVSGRGVDDIEKHTGPLPVAAAGSHGSDVRSADGEQLGTGPTGLPPAIADALRQFARENSVDFEDKPHGGALHFRSNPNGGTAATEFAERLAAKHGWVVQGGKSVVELVARGADKGSAVNAFMQVPPFAGSCPYFIGDDLTDEAGFAAVQALGGAGILVGERRQSCARYSLSSVSMVHQWLEF